MNNRLGEESINKLLWELSIPAILGMLSGAIFNIVDRIYVGRISSLALTGVGITMPVQILHMSLVLLVGVGTSTLISIRLGEGKKDEAEEILFLALKYIVIAMIAYGALVVNVCYVSWARRAAFFAMAMFVPVRKSNSRKYWPVSNVEPSTTENAPCIE